MSKVWQSSLILSVFYFAFVQRVSEAVWCTYSSLRALTHGAALHAVLFFSATLSLSGRKGHSSTSTVYWLPLLLSCRWFVTITLCHTPSLAFLIVVFIIRIYFRLAYFRSSLELYGAIGPQIFDSSLGPLWSHILGIMLLLVFFIIL